MATRLSLTLFILTLIARASGIPIQESHSVSGSVRDLESLLREGITLMVERPAKPEDLLEPNMQSTWLVHDTEAFATGGETSSADRPLDLRLTYQEWLALYFDALGLDKSGYVEWAAKKPTSSGRISILTEFDEQIDGFPMLSRIRGPYYDAVFEIDEIEALRNECLHVQSSTANVLALRGLEKLLFICDRATDLRLSIYFVSN